MSPRTTWALVGALLVVTSVASAPIGATVGTSDPDVVYQTGDGTPANETIRHVDPREVSEAGDLAMIEGWLANAMGEILAECTDGIDTGRPAVCDQLDRAYPGWLDRYEIIVDETDTEDGDRLVGVFQSSGDHQRSFRADVTEFEDTYREYQAARDAGETQRARELARNLTQLAPGIQRSGRVLESNYGVITERTRADLADEARTVNRITENKTRIAAQVENDTFIETALTATAEPSTFSFADPTTLSGRLSTANGTPIRNERVTFGVGERSVEASTDSTGSFAFTYRPTLIAANTTDLELEYRPEATSAYQSANTTIAVTIEQAHPTLTASREPATVRYGDPITTTGTVQVGETPVPGVPVGVSIAGRRLATATSTPNGTYELTGGLPATVEPGDRELTVSVLVEDQALAPASATAPITVRSTETILSVTATHTPGSPIQLSGRLTTDTGDPIAAQPVRLAVNDSTVNTVTTGTNGRYNTTVSLPAQTRGDAENTTLAITAVFSGAGTNLADSRATTTLRIEPDSEATTDGSQGVVDTLRESGLLDIIARFTGVELLGLALLVVLGGAVVLVGWRRFRHTGAGDRRSRTEPQDMVEPTSDPDHPTTDSPDPLGEARALFEQRDTDDAVQRAYRTARHRLQHEIDRAAASTHWEFATYMAENGLDENEVNALWELTEAYEHAAFAPDPVPRTTASQALDAAETLANTGR